MAIHDLNPSMPPSRPGRPAVPPPPPPPPPAVVAPPRPKPAPVPPPAPVPTPVVEAAPLAPADLVPAPSRWERGAWYAGAVVLTCVLLAAGLRLDRADLHCPLSYNQDVLLILPFVKATLETGTHWRNERLGYPGVQELYDFPVVDHLHFAILWLIGRVVSDYVVVYNLYFLLTWPLTTLTAMVAFRRLGLTLPVAAAGGVLYAFLPYHYLRGEAHYFLAAYWVVPLSCLPALAVCRGDLPFFRRAATGRYRLALWRWGTFGQVVLAAATASAGAYYAFFACALYAAAGVYGWVAHRTWKAAAAAGLVVGLVGAVGAAQHVPSIVYVAEHEPNSAAERYPEEAERYGLKVAQLLLPVDGHNLLPLARLKSAYNGGMLRINNENGSATLGAVGSAGLLVLAAVLLGPGRRGWPYGPLAALAGFILLFATVGGYGAVFNLVVFDQVRCLNRFSIYLAFLCLLAALWPVDRFLATRAGWARWLRYPAVAGLVAVGVADQTPSAWFAGPIAEITGREADRFRADRRFFTRVEDQLLTGRPDPADRPKVLTLPYVQYPEVPPVYEMEAYDHARGYLHTAAVVWSHGAMKNRAADAWLRSVSHAPPAELLRRAVARGFDGVFVDGRGFPTAAEANKLVAALRAAAPVRLTEAVHEDGRQVFLDLRAYRDWLRNLDGGKSLDAWAREEREWVAVTWLRGFYNVDPNGRQDDLRWGYPTGRAVIVNPSDRTRTFRLSAVVGVEHRGEFRVTIDGGGLTRVDRPGGPGPWAEEVVVEKADGDWNPPKRKYGVPVSYLIEVPPGRHTVRFRCRVPPLFMPESPPFCYFLKDVRFVEVK